MAISVLHLVAGLALGAGGQPATVSEGFVQFQDGAGNTLESATVGGAAVFYARDLALGTVATGTATWAAIGERVPAGT